MIPDFFMSHLPTILFRLPWQLPTHNYTRRASELQQSTTAEPVIGIVKEVLGVRQFLLRSVIAAAGGWCLVCLAWNLKRLRKLATN
jgi:hypothetical protein